MTRSSGTGVRLTRDEAVATLWLDNPRRRNALSREDLLRIPELVAEAVADDRVRVLILRGAGDDFSSGVSIGELNDVFGKYVTGGDAVVDLVSCAEEAVAQCAKPTIAAIDGHCIGGGWALAGACDLRIASARSMFGITPARLGIMYPAGAVARLVRIAGPATAKRLLFTAEIVDAATAERLGLVTHRTTVAGFGAGVDDLCRTLVGRSQFTIRSMKALVDSIAAGDGKSGDTDDEWRRRLSQSPDSAEGVRAFLEKRRPDFTWG